MPFATNATKNESALNLSPRAKPKGLMAGALDFSAPLEMTFLGMLGDVYTISAASPFSAVNCELVSKSRPVHCPERYSRSTSR